jgi:hypothetical protein
MISQISGQGTISGSKPLCTLVVKTDNGEIVDVWINRHLVGKTPLSIDTLLPGFYDISFMNPNTRDSILNSPIKSTDAISYSPYEAACKNEVLRSGRTDLQMASGELARESNVKRFLTANTSTEVIFKVNQAKDYMKTKGAKGNAKIFFGTLLGVITAVALIALLVHNTTSNLH